MSQRFEAALQFVLKWEGSKFTNDPDDRGGATRFGVTQRVYDAFRQRRGQALQSVKHISMEEVRAVYSRGYWAPVQGDRMPPPLELVLFDTAVLMGVGRAVRFLQQALGVAVDGAIGPRTLAALQGASGTAVARRVTQLREARLRGIVEHDPSQGKFLRGWLNRLSDLRRTAGLTSAEAALAEPGLDEDVGHPSADEESMSNEDFTPGEDPVGRAERDLPDDADEGPAADDAGDAGAPLQLLVAAAPEAVLAGARGLLASAGGTVLVIDLRASSADVLRAAAPSAPDAAPFDVPVQAVETVTPLGVHGADAGRLLASVTFRTGFESLAGTFGRLAGGATTPPGAGVDEEAMPAFAAAGGGDDDPAAPGAAEVSETADLFTARTLANVGTGAGTAAPEAEAAEAALAETVAIPTLDIDIGKVKAFLAACTGASPRVTYGLGAKVPFFGAVPGKDFRKVDCSGFVREAIRRATTPRPQFPDGSVVQHEWVRGRGFRKSNVEAAFKKDGAVRIAFLRPQDAPSGIGHVVLVHNAVTYESHGGTGPNSRPWTGTGWQKKAFVYRLKDPVA